MRQEKNRETEMRCPKCERFALGEINGRVNCNFCGYKLSSGEQTNYRLYKLLSKKY